MTDFFYEYEASKQFRELEALDRRLEHWGWYRRHETGSAAPGRRFRVGEALIYLGCWLQGRGGLAGVGVCKVLDKREHGRYHICNTNSQSMEALWER